MSHLLVAHPGHELLLQGWISRTKPVVHVLTDGSGRLGNADDLVRDLGARRGAIFGRLSDRAAYAMILERDAALLFELAAELAADLERRPAAMLVCDAAEGYNPVHDLCRLIAGAAIEMAGTETTLYEYAVVGDPRLTGETVRLDLDDDAYAAKVEHARRHAAALPDIDELLARHGAEPYRAEVLRRVADCTDVGGGPAPLYERFGEERVAAGRYTRIIRRGEHMAPLRDALWAAMEKRTCAY
jgi:hypothetical protein